NTKNNPRNRDQVERPAPSELMIDDSSEDVTQRAAYRDRAAKNRHDPPAHLEREIVRQNRRGGGSVTAFADADENSGDKKRGKGRGKTGGRGGEAPKNDADANDEPAREPIGEKAEN